MKSEYREMTRIQLCRLRDELEEQLYVLEQAEPDAYGKRREMENLINRICEQLTQPEA